MTTTNDNTYDDLIGVFAEAAVLVDDPKERRDRARKVPDMKVGHGDTARIADADTVIPGADRALLTVCATGTGKNRRGLLVQRDIVQHPFIKRDGEPKEDWLVSRYATYPSIEAAFEALDELRRAVGQKLRDAGVERSDDGDMTW